MGNPNQHEASIEQKPEKSGVTPPHQVLAQIAPERGEQLKLITQTAAADFLPGLPRLAVEDKSNPFASQLGARGGASADGFERFLASLTPSNRALDATARGATDQVNAQLNNAVKIDLAAGIRIDVLSQSQTRSGISLDDVLKQAPVTPGKNEAAESVVRIPGRTDMESALNGLLMANQMRAENREPSPTKLEERTAAATTAEPVIARAGETPVVVRATEEAAAVQANGERAVASGTGEPLIIRASAEAGSVGAVGASVAGGIGPEQIRPGSGEPLIARVGSEPAVTAVVGEPLVAAVVAEPSVARVVAEPSVAGVVAEPSVARVVAEPSVAGVVAEPSVAGVVAEPLVTRASEATPVITGGGEPLVARANEEPVVARAAEEPVVARAAEEPVVAKAAEEPVVARAAAEPVVTRAAEDPLIARAPGEPQPAGAVEATLSRMLEGAALRAAEDSLTGKITDVAPKHGTELPVNEVRLEKQHSTAVHSSEAPYAVPASARNIVVSDEVHGSELHHHHHRSTSILGASLTVSDGGFNSGHEHHAAASGHYHWHGTFHGHGYHRPLHGNGIDGQPQYQAFAPKSDTLVVTARSMVFTPDSNKRFMTGAEIALGVVLVSGAIAKLKERADNHEPEEKEAEESEAVQRRRKDLDAISYFQKVTASNSTRASWIIGTGDTLTSLGERFYEDARVGYLIAEINRELTQQHNIDGKLVVQLFTRQSIYLPNKEDLQQFYARNLTDLKADNLVTVVSEREFDRQLVNMIMNRAMGITAEAATTAAHLPAFAMAGGAGGAQTSAAARTTQATVAAGASTTQAMVAAGESPLDSRGRTQSSAPDQPTQASDNDRHPPLPPQAGSGAISLAGFLSYLRSKYRPEPDVASPARARLSLRCKF